MEPSSMSDIQTHERRVRVRYPYELDTLCQPGPGDLEKPWWLARSRDISTSGIGIVVGRSFDEDTLLTLDLEDDMHQIIRSVKAKVVRSTVMPTGEWCVGCIFLEPIDEATLQELVRE